MFAWKNRKKISHNIWKNYIIIHSSKTKYLHPPIGFRRFLLNLV